MFCQASQLQKICCFVSAALPQKGQSEECAQRCPDPPRKDGAKQRAFEL